MPTCVLVQCCYDYSENNIIYNSVAESIYTWMYKYSLSEY